VPGSQIHRYELIEERRASDRRERERRLGRFGAGRRSEDRRNGGSLADSEEVRRVFPIAEGSSPSQLRRREALQRNALIAADLVSLVAILAGLALLTPVRTSMIGVLLGAAAAIALSKLGGLYDRDTMVMRRSTLDEAPRIAQVAACVTLACGSAFASELSREGVVAAWGSLALAMLLARASARAVTRRSLEPERCLAIGDAAIAGHLRRKIADSRANATLVATLALEPHEHADTFGGAEGLREIVARERIDRIVLAPVSTDQADTLELVRVSKLAGVRVSVLPRLFEAIGSAVEFEDIDGITLLGLRRFGLTRSSRATKRAFDLVGSGLALFAVAPVMGLVALLVRFDSPGPIFFRQVRVGRDGNHFCIYKFRTMVEDAESLKASLREYNETTGLFKLADDPRTTRIGRLLRRTSLDELPQLFNVLRGDMSLVGPRPLVVDEDSKVLGLDRSRLHLTPGMTGHWQIMGSGRVPMDEMVSIDYLYVANWSLWSDLKILARTIPYVLGRGGM
jgi:exopolysaccharide biosynthesis polyprenyl glycosylphosphotransferase